MSRMLRHFTMGVLVAGVVCSARPAAAQAPGWVRVAHGPVRIQGWYRNPDPEILFDAGSGTILEVLGQENDWYWVIVPPDAHGTRRAGWIRVAFVEPVAKPTSGSARDQDNDQAATASDSSLPPATSAADRVVISERVEDAGSTSVRPATPTAHKFDEVHFGRDRASLRAEDMAALRAAVSALKADPALVVNIEGHTCSLGTTAHNLGLGLRRATAVKDYLVSEGIAADRLHLISLGEADAKYDNAAEETRHLNRRVALIPQ